MGPRPLQHNDLHRLAYLQPRKHGDLAALDARMWVESEATKELGPHNATMQMPVNDKTAVIRDSEPRIEFLC